MTGTKTRKILGIIGAPGSGKSTLAAEIVRALGPDLATLVPMDGFHLSNNVLLELGRRDRKGAIDTFDAMGCVLLLERIIAQTDEDPMIYAPIFRRDLEEPIACANPIRWDVPLVVVEGNYLLQDRQPWARAAGCLSESWFLEPGEELRHDRLIRRHEAYGKSPEEARAWALGSDERNAELITQSAYRADRILRLTSVLKA
jgi:pantothenate kinase